MRFKIFKLIRWALLARVRSEAKPRKTDLRYRGLCLDLPSSGRYQRDLAADRGPRPCATTCVPLPSPIALQEHCREPCRFGVETLQMTRNDPSKLTSRRQSPTCGIVCRGGTPNPQPPRTLPRVPFLLQGWGSSLQCLSASMTAAARCGPGLGAPPRTPRSPRIAGCAPIMACGASRRRGCRGNGSGSWGSGSETVVICAYTRI